MRAKHLRSSAPQLPQIAPDAVPALMGGRADARHRDALLGLVRRVRRLRASRHGATPSGLRFTPHDLHHTFGVTYPKNHRAVAPSAAPTITGLATTPPLPLWCRMRERAGSAAGRSALVHRDSAMVRVVASAIASGRQRRERWAGCSARCPVSSNSPDQVRSPGLLPSLGWSSLNPGSRSSSGGCTGRRRAPVAPWLHCDRLDRGSYVLEPSTARMSAGRMSASRLSLFQVIAMVTFSRGRCQNSVWLAMPLPV